MCMSCEDTTLTQVALPGGAPGMLQVRSPGQGWSKAHHSQPGPRTGEEAWCEPPRMAAGNDSKMYNAQVINARGMHVSLKYVSSSRRCHAILITMCWLPLLLLLLLPITCHRPASVLPVAAVACGRCCRLRCTAKLLLSTGGCCFCCSVAECWWLLFMLLLVLLVDSCVLLSAVVLCGHKFIPPIFRSLVASTSE